MLFNIFWKNRNALRNNSYFMHMYFYLIVSNTLIFLKKEMETLILILTALVQLFITGALKLYLFNLNAKY